jgi:hypothetical protein
MTMSLTIFSTQLEQLLEVLLYYRNKLYVKYCSYERLFAVRGHVTSIIHPSPCKIACPLLQEVRSNKDVLNNK